MSNYQKDKAQLKSRITHVKKKIKENVKGKFQYK